MSVNKILNFLKLHNLDPILSLSPQFVKFLSQYALNYLQSHKHSEKDSKDIIWMRLFRLFLKNDELFSDWEKNADTNNKNTINITDWADYVYEFFILYELISKDNTWNVQLRPIEARKKGVIYTPNLIVKFICRMLRKLSNVEGIHDKSLKIADLSCGTGRFLRTWRDLEDVEKFSIKDDLIGYDIDKEALEVAQNGSLSFPKGIHWEQQDVLMTEIHQSFDIILGNPPYIESRAIPTTYWTAIREKYQSAYKKFDLSVIFLERILQLLKVGGWAGLIITNKWLVSAYGERLRKTLLANCRLVYLFDLSEVSVFNHVATYPMILFFQRISSTERDAVDSNIVQMTTLNNLNQLSEIESESLPTRKITQNLFQYLPRSIIPIDLDPARFQYVQHFWTSSSNSCLMLGDLHSPYLIRDGIHTGNIRSKLITSAPQPSNPNYKRLITSRNCVQRFHIEWKGLWIRYDSNIFNRSGGDYGSLREEWLFLATPKIVIKLFGKKLQAAIDRNRFYPNNSLSVIVHNPNSSMKSQWENYFNDLEEEFSFLCGLLNSKVIDTYYRILFAHTHVRGEYIQFYRKDLKSIPIPNLTPENKLHISEIASITRKLEQTSLKTDKLSINLEELERQLTNEVADLYRLPKNLRKIIE